MCGCCWRGPLRPDLQTAITEQILPEKKADDVAITEGRGRATDNLWPPNGWHFKCIHLGTKRTMVLLASYPKEQEHPD